jgi:hypothetical protein
VGAQTGKACEPIAGDASERATAALPHNEHASASDTSIARGGGLLIYLKHRGVLNVDEFRRTNGRSV